jgi:putative ABC transport system permease protein
VNISQNIAIGMAGLLTHKMRSVLTALGIIFGVAAVIAMLSIGEGARQEALEQIQLMGVNNIIIRVKAPTQQSFGKAKANFSPGLEMRDGDALREICPFVRSIVPQWEKTTPVQYRSERKDAKIIGTTPDFLETFNYRIQTGVFLGQHHLAAEENVCVIGGDVKDALFQFENPIEKRIKIDNIWFTVIGVMDRRADPGKKMEDFALRNLNMDIYIPLTTAQLKLPHPSAAGTGGTTFINGVEQNNDQRPPTPSIDQLTVNIEPGADLGEASSIIRRILQRRHYGVDDYELIVPEALVEQSQQTQRIFNIVMGAIAGISLLVGGIGIMNIMLASVMERTKEIGIRRAIGATRADVLGQFLFEAVFLSVVGGFIGVILGYLLTVGITLYAEWKTVVSIPAVLISFTVSAIVGIAFGYYPARKAAYQNPIESLRYE